MLEGEHKTEQYGMATVNIRKEASQLLNIVGIPFSGASEHHAVVELPASQHAAMRSGDLVARLVEKFIRLRDCSAFETDPYDLLEHIQSNSWSGSKWEGLVPLLDEYFDVILDDSILRRLNAGDIAAAGQVFEDVVENSHAILNTERQRRAAASGTDPVPEFVGGSSRISEGSQEGKNSAGTGFASEDDEVARINGMRRPSRLQSSVSSEYPSAAQSAAASRAQSRVHARELGRVQPKRPAAQDHPAQETLAPDRAADISVKPYVDPTRRTGVQIEVESPCSGEQSPVAQQQQQQQGTPGPTRVAAVEPRFCVGLLTSSVGRHLRLTPPQVSTLLGIAGPKADLTSWSRLNNLFRFGVVAPGSQAPSVAFTKEHHALHEASGPRYAPLRQWMAEVLRAAESGALVEGIVRECVDMVGKVAVATVLGGTIRQIDRQLASGIVTNVPLNMTPSPRSKLRDRLQVAPHVASATKPRAVRHQSGTAAHRESRRQVLKSSPDERSKPKRNSANANERVPHAESSTKGAEAGGVSTEAQLLRAMWAPGTLRKSPPGTSALLRVVRAAVLSPWYVCSKQQPMEQAFNRLFKQRIAY